MTEDDESLVPAEADRRDAAHAAVRAALGSVPLVGAPAAELFNHLLIPPLAKRQQSWREGVARRLQEELQAGSIDAATLVESEAFKTVLVQATLVALATHVDEKRTALRNAVINTARGREPRPGYESVFIRYVEELTPDHLALLAWLARHEDRLKDEPSFEILRHHAPHLDGPSLGRDEFRLCLLDLDVRGLIRLSEDLEDFDDVHTSKKIVTSDPIEGPKLRVTDLGKSFLKFVSRPSEEGG